MDDKKLGTLELVKLRDTWESESSDFTPWLARDENLEILGNTIGLELELKKVEENVGPFRADIVCKDISRKTSNESLVLIENQLEPTDHTHLGQLLTYAAGLDAVTIIWVAARFTEEHRAALDWLNKITDEKISFFGLRTELWKIGDSKPAPKFNVVSAPNNWSRRTAKIIRTLSPAQVLYLDYWSTFFKTANITKTPYYDGWCSFPLGKATAYILLIVSIKNQRIGAYVEIWEREMYDNLNRKIAELQKELRFKLEVVEKHNKTILKIEKQDYVENKADWEEQHKWLKEKLEALTKVFKPRIQAL